MKKSFTFTCMMAAIAIIFNACASNEIGNSKDVTPETIYQQYNITYIEGEEKVKVLAQFRFAGENGTTLVLSSPSNIELDGKKIPVDSSSASGAYYEALYAAEGFKGKHQFVFTDINGTKKVNECSFEQFNLMNVPSIAYKNQPLEIPFNATALGPDDYLQINSENSDSTFSITQTALDTHPVIQIPVKELQRQKGDKIGISVTLFKKIPLQNPTKEGGFIMIEYYLKPVTIKLENNPPIAFQYTFTSKSINLNPKPLNNFKQPSTTFNNLQQPSTIHPTPYLIISIFF